MRDAFLFATDKTQPNISIGGKDNHWQGPAPAAIASHSTSATYSVGSYVQTNGKLYRCIEAITTAGAFADQLSDGKWELCVNETVVSQSYYMVAVGGNRSSGSSLGAFSLPAAGGLDDSGGYSWRSRLSPQKVL